MTKIINVIFKMCALIFDTIQNIISSFYTMKTTKIIDNTPIDVVKDHIWTDHFCKMFRGNEPYTHLKMKELLPELEDGSYIIDVGSNIGDTGLYLAYHLQTMYPYKLIDVIMIEPDESKVDFIRKMIQLNNLTNCTVINCGVSDESCCGKIEKNDKFPGVSIIKEKEGEDIIIEKIDNITKGINCIVSMMHINVDGMEYKSLVGSVDTLKNVKYIIISMNDICDRNDERVFLKNNDYVRIPNVQMYNEDNNELYVKEEQHILDKKNQ